MDPRIGILMRNGKEVYYTIDPTYGPMEGSLLEVEHWLGIGVDEYVGTPIKAPIASPSKASVYDVVLMFQFPAWDEIEGIVYKGIVADSKSGAILQVRKMAYNDGHTAAAKKGRYYFKAVQKD